MSVARPDGSGAAVIGTPFAVATEISGYRRSGSTETSSLFCTASFLCLRGIRRGGAIFSADTGGILDGKGILAGSDKAYFEGLTGSASTLEAADAPFL